MVYQPPTPGNKIIIVGGGCFGLSTAYALSLKGIYDVWVYDRQTIPAPDAASTERADMGQEPVFHPSGVLLFSSNGEYSDFEQQSMRHIREAGYGHVIEELGPKDIISRYPYLKDAVGNGYNIGYLNKAGGWCNSAEAVKHLYTKCVANGVNFVQGPKGELAQVHCNPNNPKEVIGIKTTDGLVHLADRVVLATGSWTAGLVDVSDQLVASGQIVVHFNPPQSISQQLKDQPVWCADLSRTGYYGFPTNGDGKVKVGRHFSGYLYPRQDGISIPRTQVTHAADTIPIKDLREMRGFLDQFLPCTSSLDVSYARVCWYSDSIDGNFLVAPHPEYSNLIVASGDSGHGMKFITTLGFKICHVIEGIDSEYSRAWAWHHLSSEDVRLDGLRADVNQKRPILIELGNEEARMALAKELLHQKSRL
ncbi:FAD dependent oxidoreductase-domain-containing protein [Phycomyces nitens]|nr:FAD dependent oxidoreductase-domain-containing protein [Phycomyces nitens]